MTNEYEREMSWRRQFSRAASHGHFTEQYIRCTGLVFVNDFRQKHFPSLEKQR